eukprot:evm.model.scf_390.3 EVM.evm.TU.scf_390.3   scf_390:62565-69304(-)
MLRRRSRESNRSKEKTYVRFLDVPTANVNSDFELGDVLGRGQFGTTRVAVERRTGRRYACKSSSKKKMKHPSDVEDVKREIQILHHLAGHPNVVMLKAVYEDSENIHLVMELCTGGELFESIIDRGCYTERDAADAVRTMLQVVAHCHHMGIIHRDLKPENFLLANATEFAPLKAIDFGLSVFFKEGEMLDEIVGTPFYVAPEVLKKRYSKEVDIWSMGVILYILLCGAPPFYGESEDEIFEAIEYAEPDFESDPWPEISEAAIEVCRMMLVVDPSERATAEELLGHPWLAGDECDNCRPLNPVVGRLRGFAEMNKLKKQALKVIASHLPREEIEGLRQIFLTLDSDGNGKITVEELKQGLKLKGSSIPDADLSQLMSEIDLDGNGFVDYEEFLAATLNLSNLHADESLVQAFRHFDTDNSGYITKDEMFDALKGYGITDHNINQILAEADKDNNGAIDFQEFCEMILGVGNGFDIGYQPGEYGVSAGYGASGEYGFSGEYGASGEYGISGEYGTSGEYGVSGDYRATSENGVSGDYRATSEHGVSGDYRASSEYGVSGEYGASGQYTASGEYGASSECGVAGFYAPAHEYGVAGVYGTSGEYGASGEYGETREYGVSGEYGTIREYGGSGQYGMPGEYGAPGECAVPGHCGLSRRSTSSRQRRMSGDLGSARHHRKRWR